MDTRTKGWREAGRNRDGAMEGIGLKFCSAFPSLSDDLKLSPGFAESVIRMIEGGNVWLIWTYKRQYLFIYSKIRRLRLSEFPLPSLPLNEYYTSLRVKPSYAISRNTTI